jgi:hypothetical protein
VAEHIPDDAIEWTSNGKGEHSLCFRHLSIGEVRLALARPLDRETYLKLCAIVRAQVLRAVTAEQQRVRSGN